MRTIPLESTRCCGQHKSHTFVVPPLAGESARTGPFLQEAGVLLTCGRAGRRALLSSMSSAQPVLNKAERNGLSWGAPRVPGATQRPACP